MGDEPRCRYTTNGRNSNKWPTNEETREATDATDSLSSTHKGWRSALGEDSIAGVCLRLTQASAALNTATPHHSNCSGNVFCTHTINFVIKIYNLGAGK